MIDILQGLCALHENGVVHCDLKMPNILLDENNVAKITDFGIAKNLKFGKTNKTILDGFSERILCYEYLVEQKISTKGDIWSYGILIYEMMTNSFAWQGLTGTQTVIQVSQKKPFRQFNQKIGNAYFDELVEKCINYDYKERPTAQQLLSQLLEFQSQN